MGRGKIVVLAIALIFLLVRIASAAAAPDPTRISIGARVLGLGSACMGLDGDANSIYSNPANLSSIDYWQIASMSGNLLEEYNYFSLSGIYPTKYGKFGIGIVSSNIGGAIPTKVEELSDPSDPIYVEDTSLSNMGYYNNVLLMSYSNKLEGILSFYPIKRLVMNTPWMNDIDYGMNFKIFSVGLSGGGLSNTSGSGTEIDLGIKGKTAIKGLSYGATIKDMLPASLGGKLTYPNGWEESYPAVLKMGVAANILGEENAMQSFNNQDLKVLLDINMYPKLSVPALYKLGVEWSPINLLSIRAGIDQAMVGGNVSNDLTAGIGVNFKGFRFDYAYHQFEGAYGVDNHFFSLNYGLIPPPKEDKDYIIIIKPSPTSITHDYKVNVVGKVHPDVGSAKINGTWISIDKDLNFNVEVPFALKKNTLWVQAYSRKGELLETEKLRVLRLVSYPDVTSDYWTYDPISYIGTLGIIKGYPDGTFKPEGYITRAELATLLIRVTQNGEVPAPAKVSFSDFTAKHWAAGFIEQAAKLNIVKGYPDKTFKPKANITRAEGLAMITRFGKVEQEPYDKVLFRDVDSNHWAAKTIAGAYKADMLQYLRGKPFDPNKKLTRAEAVELISKTALVKDKINTLLDFETGYETEINPLYANVIQR